MTAEEKYQEIVNSRKSATEDKPTETEKQPEDKNPSGVKTDPPAEKEKTPEPGKQPEDGGKKPPETEEKSKGAAKQPTSEEQAQHAFAQLRFKSKRENDALRKEIEDLKKQIASQAPKPQEKTRKDFASDEEYSKHLRDTLKEELRAEIMGELNDNRERTEQADSFEKKLRSDLESAFPKGVADKVINDLYNPESEMTMILTDERAESMIDAMKGSKRFADLMALMQAKPQIFQSILELPPRRQEFRIYQLEDQIDAKYAQLNAKKQEQERHERQQKERADSMPTPGQFGQGDTTNKGVSGLSATERVRRIQEEILKGRTRH